MSLLLTARRRRNPTYSQGGGLPPEGVITETYTRDNLTDFGNPDRGWYVEDAGGLTVNKQNQLPVRSHIQYPNLQMKYVRLDAYAGTDTLPPEFLGGLASEMASWRTTGKKAVLRYAYNRGAPGTDAPWPRMKGHIQQLSPLWHDYRDVIGSFQAGFVGEYGEHWGGTNGIPGNTSQRRDFVHTILEETPDDMFVEFRTPWWVMDAFDGVIPPAYADRFGTTAKSRVGHHNDCYGAGQWMVTYWDDGGFYQQQQRDYADAIGKIGAAGGETCNAGGGLTQWNDGPYIIQQMEMMGWDYLNSEYWTGMMQKWHDTGYLAQISRRLGYRLHLDEATLTANIVKGSPMLVELSMFNSGFGKVFNPRPIDLVLVGGSNSYSIRLSSDARRDLPLGGETKTLSYSPNVPSNIPNGTYSAYLALPDPSANLNTDARYAIRLANTGMWDSGGGGRNSLGMSVTVGD